MRLLLTIFTITFIIYLLSSPGETPYNYFTRLSQSFVSGKLYLNENPPWLNELVPVDSKYYVVYPPMPAVLIMPLVFLFGQSVSQTLFSIFLGAVNTMLVYLLLKRLFFSTSTAFLVTIFFGIGTNHWYLSSIGSVWFIAHIVALFFLLLSLLETFGKQRLWLIGVLLGASFWSRTTEIFTLPFFYIILWNKFWPSSKISLRNIFLLHAGIALFVLIDFWYNFVRFGSVSPLVAYNLIPNISNDPVFRDGFMSFTFIPRHLEAMLLKLPKFSGSFPYIIPSLYSMAIWFTSPALVYSLKAKRSLLIVSCWMAVLFTFLVISLWAGVGYAQFGYRFAQDFMPFLLILVASGIGERPKKLAYFLVALSTLVNIWGVVTINFLNKWIL